ncbi:MAG: hypothetical protein K2I18_01575 [Paramuribaculum sp.]|nr:hypothetical protein [Paramuribaculum sp.]
MAFAYIAGFNLSGKPHIAFAEAGRHGDKSVLFPLEIKSGELIGVPEELE